MKFRRVENGRVWTEKDVPNEPWVKNALKWGPKPLTREEAEDLASKELQRNIAMETVIPIFMHPCDESFFSLQKRHNAIHRKTRGIEHAKIIFGCSIAGLPMCFIYSEKNNNAVNVEKAGKGHGAIGSNDEENIPEFMKSLKTHTRKGENKDFYSAPLKEKVNDLIMRNLIHEGLGRNILNHIREQKAAVAARE